MFGTPNIARLTRRGDVDRLVTALAWPKDDTVREAAARALGTVGDDRAVDPLLEAVASGSVPLAAAATGALDALDGRGHRVPAAGLIAALRRQPWPPLSYRTPDGVARRVRSAYDVAGKHARALLRRRAGAGDVPALAELLADDRIPFTVQSAAIAALAATGAPAAVRPLAEQLAGAMDTKLPHPLASEAFFALASFRDPSTVDVLASRLHRQDRLTSRELKAFCAIPDPAVDEHLKALLADRTEPKDLKLLADAALARTPSPPADRLAELAVLCGDSETAASLGTAAVDGLLAALGHRSNRVRQTALEALRRVPDPRAFDAIAACVRDDHYGVSNAAVPALAALTDPRVTDILVELVTEPAFSSRTAVDALSGTGDRRAVGALIRWWRSADRHRADIATRRHVLECVGRLGGDEAVDALLAMLADPDLREDKPAIVWALGETRDARAVEPLLRALADGIFDRDDNWRIASALGTIGDRRAVPVLCEMLSDTGYFHHNQRAAAGALADIGDPSALPALRKVYSPTVAKTFVSSDDDYHGAAQDSMRTIEMAIHRLENPD